MTDSRSDMFRGRYADDWLGSRWIYETRTGYYVLVKAFLDGWCSSGRNPETRDDYESVTDMDDLAELLSRRTDLRRKLDHAYAFVSGYMSGGFRLWRGMSWDRSEWRDACRRFGFVPETGRELLRMVDNTTKEFSSFSVSRDVAAGMFTGRGDRVSLLISGIAEPADVLYAFTMFLIGKYGTDAEQELVIGHGRPLGDMRVELYENPFD